MDRRRLSLVESGSDATRTLVVLVSGNGSNLQAILDACSDGSLNAEVAAVISNVAGAFALERAAQAGTESVVITPHSGETRETYDRRLSLAVAKYRPDFVLLAGWMRILTAEFLDHFAVVNLHPALPGDYPGLHAVRRAFDDARAGLRDHTGVMVHFVPDEGVDDGPVIATATVPILPDDDLETLVARVHGVEHRLLVDALRSLCTSDSPRPHRAVHI